MNKYFHSVHPLFLFFSSLDPVIEQLQSVTVGIVVPALCIGMIIAAAYLFHRYLSGKDQHSPNILVIEMHINILAIQYLNST